MSLTSATIPETVSAIGSCAFYYCTSLTSTNIPTNVTNIGESAFEGCNNLTNVTISEGVKSIGNRAFCSCESLTSVTIPKTISAIGSCAFLGCTGLMDITSMIRYPFPIDSDVFDDYVSTNSTLHVPARTSRQYMETEGWNRFENIVELDNEDDEDGIVITPLTTANIENTYNSSGCKHSTPQKGINIIRMSDGTTKKVLVR